MELAEGFRTHKEKIISRWCDYTLSTYISSGFFLKEKDLFANPVGANVRAALNCLFPLLVEGAEKKDLLSPLEQILLIRSVQDFSPSQALAPLNAIKHIVREVFQQDKECQHLISYLYDFDFGVDLAILAAFDIYMECRERLYKVRIAEIKSGRHILTESKCSSRLLSDDNKKVFEKVSGF